MKHTSRLVAVIFLLSLFLAPMAQADFLTAKECARLVIDTIEAEYSHLFEVISVDYNERRLVAYVENEGLATTLRMAYEAGFDDKNYPPWVEYKEDFLAAYNFIADKLAEHERSDISFEMWLYNDDTRAGKRSPFIKYLAYATSRDWVDDCALDRYEDPEQDVSELPEEIQPIFTDLQTMYEANFDYVSIFYNKDRKLFIIEVAMKGLGETLYTVKQAGYDETWEPWVEMRTSMTMMYAITRAYLDELGREDVQFTLELVNDEVHIKGYNDRISFDPLLHINSGYVLDDIMK